MSQLLAETTVGSLVMKKSPIISVPDTATVQTALKQVMISNDIVALPVAAPPGKWMGAGQSVIVDRDKQYIGMVSMVDVAMHVAAWRCAPDALMRPVVDLIGASNEGLSLWVYDSSAYLVDVMEPLSKGVHRLLIRLPQLVPGVVHPPGGRRNETASVSDYAFLSQMDVVSYLLSNLDFIGPVAHRSLTELSLVDSLFPPLAVAESVTVLDTLRLMRKAQGIRAIAVVAEEEDTLAAIPSREGKARGEPTAREEQAVFTGAGDTPMSDADAASGGILLPLRATWCRGGRLIGTLSVSDLRGLDAPRLLELGTLTVGEFLLSGASAEQPRVPVACRPQAPLSLVMALAVSNRVHRVWVTAEDDYLEGVVSLSDIISVLRRGIEQVASGA